MPAICRLEAHRRSCHGTGTVLGGPEMGQMAVNPLEGAACCGCFETFGPVSASDVACAGLQVQQSQTGGACTAWELAHQSVAPHLAQQAQQAAAEVCLRKKCGDVVVVGSGGQHEVPHWLKPG